LVETLKRLQKEAEEKAVQELRAVQKFKEGAETREGGEKKDGVAAEKKLDADGAGSTLRETGAGQVESVGKKDEEGGGGHRKHWGRFWWRWETVTPEDVAYAVQKQLEGDGRSIGGNFVGTGDGEVAGPDCGGCRCSRRRRAR